jgi:hypothetical protein
MRNKEEVGSPDTVIYEERSKFDKTIKMLLLGVILISMIIVLLPVLIFKAVKDISLLILERILAYVHI